MKSKTLDAQLEFGSYFHWPAAFVEPRFPWPNDPLWLARGRDAISLLANSEAWRTDKSRLFLPDYFCPSVSSYWRHIGISICLYHDSPLHNKPEFTDNFPEAHDFVLVVNYFGVTDRCEWCNEIELKFGAATIEDHTHDPLSSWARDSAAFLCFASIRKTMPITDGAILWTNTLSASDLFRNSHEFAEFNDVELSLAMSLKGIYLQHKPTSPELKDYFRKLQTRGHEQLENDARILKISQLSLLLAKPGMPAKWRTARSSNARMLIDSLGSDMRDNLLFSDWRSDQSPFVVPMLFETTNRRDAFREALIRRDIFPAIHWEIPASVSKKANLFSRRVISLPVDQRYDARDMELLGQRVHSALKEIAH